MKNIKTITIIVITAIVCISSTVYATAKYIASEVTYKNTTVENALNELYKSNNSNKYVKYNEDTKNIEVYNKTKNTWIVLKHYDNGLPLTGNELTIYNKGEYNIEFEKINRAAYNGIEYKDENDYIHLIGNTNGGGGGIYSKEKINLSFYSKMIIKGTFEDSKYPSTSYGVFGFVAKNKKWDSSYIPSDTVILKNIAYTQGNYTLEIDISNINDEYYIGVGINQCDATITSIELK